MFVDVQGGCATPCVVVSCHGCSASKVYNKVHVTTALRANRIYCRNLSVTAVAPPEGASTQTSEQVVMSNSLPHAGQDIASLLLWCLLSNPGSMHAHTPTTGKSCRKSRVLLLGSALSHTYAPKHRIWGYSLFYTAVQVAVVWH